MNIIDKIAAWSTHLYITLGIMRLWSLIHAWLFEYQEQGTPLARYAGLGPLVGTIASLKWKADSWRELGDAVSSLAAIQWRIDNDPGKFIGDCDEFGRYSAAVIRNELRLNHTWGSAGIDTTFLLTTMWKKTGGETWEGNQLGYGGHNVCLIHYLDGTWAYMDYGWPSPKVASISAVVKQIRDRYAQVYEPLGYAWSDPDSLKCVGSSLD